MEPARRIGSPLRGAGRQIHDANIAATMIAHGERRLLTFNAGDFQRFGTLIELVNTKPHWLLLIRYAGRRPGIHVFVALSRERRGWRGQAPP
jgi:hypothetical protein